MYKTITGNTEPALNLGLRWDYFSNENNHNSMAGWEF